MPGLACSRAHTLTDGHTHARLPRVHARTLITQTHATARKLTQLRANARKPTRLGAEARTRA